jgi:hypothetical protein
LTIAACRECSRALDEMAQEDRQTDDLLRSRSEVFADDPYFWNPHADPWA